MRDPGSHVGVAAHGLDTRAVHAGREPDTATGAVVPPIHLSSTFAVDGIGSPRAGWTYGRVNNPTRQRLETALAELEGARHAVCFASGVAAAAMVADLVEPGERILSDRRIYGGTYRLFEQVLSRRGIGTHYVDLQDCATSGSMAARLDGVTRAVWFETPTNPLLSLIDIAAVSRAARHGPGARGEPPLVIVDGTFATPALQNPLTLGADIVYHSASKYFSGHSDTIHGVVLTDRDDLAARLRLLQTTLGATPSPFDCFLVLRGLQTFGLRMARHLSNASAVAGFLDSRTDVERVFYPGIRDTFTDQMSGAGGIVSFLPASDTDAERRAVRICESLQLFTVADSLGGVESLASMPARMSHAAMAGTDLAMPGALIRLSCGIEGPDDLIADLGRALDATSDDRPERKGRSDGN